MGLSRPWSAGALVAVLAVSLGIVALQIRDQPAFSPIDEVEHFDYAVKAPSAGLRAGELYGTEALAALGCRGRDWPGWEVGAPTIPKCGDAQPDPRLSPNMGYNAAYLHPPVYYSLTALIGDGMLRLPGVGSTLSAYRLVGVLWLGAGLVLIWLALGMVHLSVWRRVGVVLLLGVSPAVVHGSATVNPDATALFGGGLVALALLKWEAGRWPWWSLAVASTVAVWLKFTNSIAVGALIVYLAVRLWQTRNQPSSEMSRAKSRQRYAAGSVTVAAVVASVLVWRVVQRLRQLAPEEELPIHIHLRRDSFPWTSVDDKLRAVLTPLRHQWIPSGLPRDALVLLSDIADVGLLVLLGAAVAVTASRSPYRALVVAVFTSMVGIGALALVSFYLTLSYDPPVPGRYGLAVLPLAAVAVAPVLRRHILAPALVGALACATASAMFYGVLTT
ncbi:MAG: hypothetical protein OXI32_07450 [bacterium]|nr:hypothetical protein [bacterium]